MRILVIVWLENLQELRLVWEILSKTRRKGSITANLYIQGIQGHVAYPHLAENPVR